MNGIVQVKMMGGFGNQLHQYAAARTYAEQIGARFECPDWPGREIFGLMDPEWSRDLPEVNDGGAGTPPEVQFGQTNVRIGGYFQHQRWIDPLSRATLRRWFQVQPHLLDIVPQIPGPYVAVHCRRGDYVNHPCYATVSSFAYDRAIQRAGYDPDHVVWVTDDSPQIVEGIPPRISFLPDWLTLLRAAVLFRGNSTFSWWAAVLSDARVFAPVVDDAVGLCDPEFVDGNWPRCAHTARTGVMVEDLYLPE